MRLRVDRESDALYLRLDERAIAGSEEVSPGVILDFDSDDKLVGIEILNLSKQVPAETLATLQFDSR